MNKKSFKRLTVISLAGLFILGESPVRADNPNVYPGNTPDDSQAPGNMAAVASPDASAPPADSGADAAKEAALTPDQLDTLVAPIALYPDTLVSQILVASTYPLEIVQAAQWLSQNSTLKGPDLTKAAQQQSWDASIQALVVFPDVIKRLSQDVTWTTNVGNAFLARQADVMDSVQRMRLKAEQSGKLKSTEQEKVTTTTQEGQKVVEIAPTNPDVVYVPYYDPAVIWGPPAYYSYPAWDYPAGPYGADFWFGSGISLSFCFGAGWNAGWGWGWRPSWHDRTVIVNNRFIERANFHRTEGISARGAGPGVWHHEAVHRMGVAYPSRALSGQFHPAAMRARPSAAQVQTQFHASAQRVSIGNTAGDRFGHRNIQATSYNRNHSAFAGVGEGASTRVFSSRGNASLSHTAVRSGGGVHTSVGHASGGGGHVSGGGGHVSGGGGHTSGGGGGFSGGGHGR
jgi:Protein of unknown function (DUF3300)